MRAAESVLQQRERYRRRARAANQRDVVQAVLAHVTLDELTASCLIKALARTGAQNSQWMGLQGGAKPRVVGVHLDRGARSIAFDREQTPVAPSAEHAQLSITTADWLLETQPQVAGTSQVLDAAIAAASLCEFQPDTALRFYQLRDSYGLPPSVQVRHIKLRPASAAQQGWPLRACGPGRRCRRRCVARVISSASVQPSLATSVCGRCAPSRDAQAVNLAITACSHSGRVKDALELLEGMAERGLVPTTYSVLMTLQAANFKHKGRVKVIAWGEREGARKAGSRRKPKCGSTGAGRPMRQGKRHTHPSGRA